MLWLPRSVRLNVVVVVVDDSCLFVCLLTIVFLQTCCLLVIFFSIRKYREYVSMELDDPFGDDPNDFDDLGMAEIVFEDIYITLYKRDGMESAEKLRDRVVKQEMKGDALETFHNNFGDSLSRA